MLLIRLRERKFPPFGRQFADPDPAKAGKRAEYLGNGTEIRRLT
jgi:hypothetical protein